MQLRDVQIRRLSEQDAHAWTRLRLEALESHPLAFGSSIPENENQLREIFRRRIQLPESVIFGALTDGNLIGICGVVRFENQKERHKAIIVGMYVSSRSRRKGIGRQLLEACIAQSKSWEGVELVHLTVSEVASEARALYEKFGFTAWGRETNALKFNEHYADESHMVLRIRP